VITRPAGIVPVASQTMLSQLAHLSFRGGPVYVYIQAATAAVLLLAANTSYNDLPRVLFLMARDRQAPRSFLRIGDRLTFRNGILLLSVASAALYIVFRGNTESLLPLYAVGVFLAFTLSQAGMIMHWRRHRDQPHWRRSLVFNATGAVLSGIVFRHRGRHQVHRRSLGRHRPHRSDHRDRAAHPAVLGTSASSRSGSAAGPYPARSSTRPPSNPKANSDRAGSLLVACTYPLLP
jgi:hypothetical protein